MPPASQAAGCGVCGADARSRCAGCCRTRRCREVRRRRAERFIDFVHVCAAASSDAGGACCCRCCCEGSRRSLLRIPPLRFLRVRRLVAQRRRRLAPQTQVLVARLVRRTQSAPAAQAPAQSASGSAAWRVGACVDVGSGRARCTSRAGTAASSGSCRPASSGCSAAAGCCEGWQQEECPQCAHGRLERSRGDGLAGRDRRNAPDAHSARPARSRCAGCREACCQWFRGSGGTCVARLRNRALLRRRRASRPLILLLPDSMSDTQVLRMLETRRSEDADQW